MRKFTHQFAWLFFILCVLVGLVFAIPNFMGHRVSASNGNATLIPSASTVLPNQTLSMTAHGFAAGEIVQVNLYKEGPVLGQLSCDTNGNCDGTVTTPRTNITQGQYSLIATGKTSKLTAYAPIVFAPTLYSLTDIPGAYVHLKGAAFTANETVQVYWGTNSGMLEGTTVTDGVGNFSFAFTTPIRTGEGMHPITVIRTNQFPATVATFFQVLAPQVSGGIAEQFFGVKAYLHLSGFAAHETVFIQDGIGNGNFAKVYGNGKVDLGNAKRFSTGFFDYPLPPRGSSLSLKITVVGQSSGLLATLPLYYARTAIVLKPNTGIPGSTITVNGVGFAPNVIVPIHFSGSAPVLTKTDAVGSFSTSLTVPLTNNPKEKYYVFTNLSGVPLTQFFFTPLRLVPNIPSISFGMPIQFTGQGFAANERVNLFWNYGQSGHILAASVITANDGTFTTTMDAPSTPHLSITTISARGSLTNAQVTTTVNESAGVVLLPIKGRAGMLIQINGGGFDSNEQVVISLRGTVIKTEKTNDNGSFLVGFVIPTSTAIGNYKYKLVGKRQELLKLQHLLLRVLNACLS